jgi:hypothetical protein
VQFASLHSDVYSARGLVAWRQRSGRSSGRIESSTERARSVQSLCGRDTYGEEGSPSSESVSKWARFVLSDRLALRAMILIDAPGRLFVIQPIRPVSWNICPPALLPCGWRFGLACARLFRTCTSRTPKIHFDSHLTCIPAHKHVCPPPFRPELCFERSSTVKDWQPWPSTPPRVGGAVRWWPSDEVPPTPPPATTASAIPTLIIHLPNYGRLEIWA